MELHKKKMEHYEKAIELSQKGKNPYDMKYQSTKMQLLDFKQKGVKNVRWVASYGSRTCKKCESLNGHVFDIDEILKEMPLPLKDCNNLDDGCRCCWVPMTEINK